MPEKPAYILVQEMPGDKVTHQEGRWYLRHARFEGLADVFIVSAVAPQGTLGRDLRPQFIDILPDPQSYDEREEISLPADAILALLSWPPD